MTEQPPTDPMLPVEPEPPPALDPATVADDESLAFAVDTFIGQDRNAIEHLGWIVFEQELLRQAAPPDVWQMILHVDETCVARWADLTLALARWAFAEGQRHPVEPTW